MATSEVGVDSPAAAVSTEEIEAGVEAVGLAEDAGQNLKLDQATLFRCVEDGNISSLSGLLKHRNVDINAYNDEGVTALHLAVYKYEEVRSLEVINFLLAHGADISLKAAVPPSAHKISIIRHGKNDPFFPDFPMETKKISLDQKTPLLVALELKSTLYLRGWEYRHWDDMLRVLADATIKHLSSKQELRSPRSPILVIQKNWAAVFESGKHETIEVWSEGKHLIVLKLLLTGVSKNLKHNIDNADMQSSNRLDFKDASFNVVKAIMHFLYTGKVETHFLESRGLDLLLAAHKYGIKCLTWLCEDSIHATQDNWIKLLSAAMECNSDMLSLKCAESIKQVMDKRHGEHNDLRKSFSDIQTAPYQLFSSR